MCRVKPGWPFTEGLSLLQVHWHLLQALLPLEGDNDDQIPPWYQNCYKLQLSDTIFHHFQKQSYLWGLSICRESVGGMTNTSINQRSLEMYLKVHVTHGSLDFLKYRTWSVSNSILIISVLFFLFEDICEISQRWVNTENYLWLMWNKAGFSC